LSKSRLFAPNLCIGNLVFDLRLVQIFEKDLLRFLFYFLLIDVSFTIQHIFFPFQTPISFFSSGKSPSNYGKRTPFRLNRHREGEKIQPPPWENWDLHNETPNGFLFFVPNTQNPGTASNCPHWPPRSGPTWGKATAGVAIFRRTNFTLEIRDLGGGKQVPRPSSRPCPGVCFFPQDCVTFRISVGRSL
jgi:hypothetical protein